MQRGRALQRDHRRPGSVGPGADHRRGGAIGPRGRRVSQGEERPELGARAVELHSLALAVENLRSPEPPPPQAVLRAPADALPS